MVHLLIQQLLPAVELPVGEHHSLVRPAWEPHASADSERLEQQVSAEHSQPAWQLAELQMACAVQVELEQLAGPELLIGQEQLACSAQVLPSTGFFSTGASAFGCTAAGIG